MLHAGDSIDRYTVETVLGTGGTAVVYRVRHETLGTLHALKVLSVTSDVIRERMLTEGRVQAALSHINVVGVSDVLNVHGAPGLLMEYIDGPPLDKAIDKYRINRESAETLFVGIATGVHEAHEDGLVHRDLKPANVLLARTIDGFVPKVTDFGLAKVLEEAQGGEGHTRSGIALGTPAYMAPEQIRDAATVDQRADVFALGCILYELVTRRRAFPGDDTIAIYNAVLDGRFVPPRYYLPDLEDRIDLAIRGALISEREQRISSVATLLEVLGGEKTWDIPERQSPSDDIELIYADEEGSMGGRRPDLPIAISRHGIPMEDHGTEFDPLMASIHDASYRGALPQGDRPDLPTDTFPDPEPEVRSASGLLFFGGAGLVFLAALLIAVGGTVAALVSGPDGPSTEAVVPAEPSIAVAVTAEQKKDQQAEAAEPVPVAPEVAPAPRQNPVVPRPAPRPEPPAEVTVKILSSPPTATLVVDGVQNGRTPSKLSLAPGKHSIEVRSGSEVGEFTIDVARGTENKWCYSFGAGTSNPGGCL